MAQTKSKLNQIAQDSAITNDFIKWNGSSWAAAGTTAITGSGTTGYLPKFTSTSALGLSKAFETTNTFSIGTNTAIDTYTRMYIFGGANGANVDARPGGGGYDQSTFDAQSSDFATTFKSVHLRYQGPGALGTTLGISNANLSDLTFNDASTAIIQTVSSGSPVPILFGINGVKVGQISDLGLEVRTGKSLFIYDSDNTNYVELKTPATGSLTTSYTLTLPVDDGTSGQYLQTDGSGALSWQTVSGGGSSSGIAGAVQISGGAGAFSSDATNFFFDTTTKQLQLAGGTGYQVYITGVNDAIDIAPGTLTSAYYALRASSSNTGTMNIGLINTSATTSANARLLLSTASGGGDPYVTFDTGDSTYTVGTDNSGDIFYIGIGSSPSAMTTPSLAINSAGNIGVYNVIAPTAKLHIAGGTASANTAPIKLSSGTAMTAPEDGAIEYHTSHLYFTIGSTRYQLDQQAITIADGDKGDITVSSSGAVWTIDNLAVTDAKINDVSVAKLTTGIMVSGLNASLPASGFMDLSYDGATALSINDLTNEVGIYSKDATQSFIANNTLAKISSGTSKMEFIDGVLRLYDSDATHFIALQTPATGSLTTSYTLTLPNTDGAANQILYTNGSGVLEWGGSYLDNGNVIGEAASIDSEIALFSGTGGKTIKRATGTGVAIVTSGVLSTKTNPTGAFVGESDTQTLSAKRIDPRVTSTTSSSTPTPNIANEDIYILTALAVNATFGSPTGTPVQGSKLLIRIKDNGTARTLAWNAIYRAIGVTLPTTTVINKTLYVGCVYNSTDTKWDILAVTQEV